MIKRLRESNNPNLFLLSYGVPSFQVLNFIVIPKHFFTPEVIEKRQPLSMTARRAGWVGCNILLNRIPQSGKISFVTNGIVKPKRDVLAEWQRTLFLREERGADARGWLLDVMNCVEKIGSSEFSLQQIYSFEKKLSEKYPQNQHIREKMRQQLQVLRDKGYITFLRRGRYRLTRS